MAEPIVNTLGIVGMKHCGAYDSATNYEKLNVVAYQGSSYCAKGNTVGNLPTNTTYWDLLAQKGDTGQQGETGPQGPKPVKGVDYYTESDIADLESTLSDDVTTEVTSQLSDLTSATPLVANSADDMTDTTRIYVLTTDGHWYWYDGDSWEDGGVYQATEISDKSVTYNKTDFLVLGNQLFNKDTITSGKYVNYLTGNLADHAGSVASDYIIVDGLSHVIHTYSNQCAFYNSEKTFISGYNSNEADVPANAYYLRISLPNSPTYTNGCMLNSGTTLLPYEKYKYKANYIEIDKNRVDFETNKIVKDETNFVVASNNLIDYNDIEIGKYVVPNTGNIATNANYFLTGKIKVKGESKITVSPYKSNMGVYLAFYNSNNNYISGDSNSETINIPSNAEYMLFSAPINYIDKLMVIFGATTGREYEPHNNYLYKTSGKKFYVGSNRTITTLKEGIEEATKYWGSIVYVDKGTYDLVSEFGSSYLDNTSTDRGLVLKNRVHIIFDSNAYVKFNYTGSSQFIHENFSPFNAGLYGFTIENLNLECSNCRYCVHDERGGSTDSYINKYINCKMSLDNSQNPDWSNPQNIGAGLGERGYVIVDGCHFNNWCTWHNNNNHGYLASASKVIIKNNYFDEGFIFATDDSMTAFTNPSLFYVYNNCKKGNIITTEGNTNIIVKEWNNIQHD